MCLAGPEGLIVSAAGARPRASTAQTTVSKEETTTLDLDGCFLDVGPERSARKRLREPKAARRGWQDATTMDRRYAPRPPSSSTAVVSDTLPSPIRSSPTRGAEKRIMAGTGYAACVHGAHAHWPKDGSRRGSPNRVDTARLARQYSARSVHRQRHPPDVGVFNAYPRASRPELLSETVKNRSAPP